MSNLQSYLGDDMRNISFALLLIVLFFISSCTDKYEVPSENIAQSSGSGCVDCHTDKDLVERSSRSFTSTSWRRRGRLRRRSASG